MPSAGSFRGLCNADDRLAHRMVSHRTSGDAQNAYVKVLRKRLLSASGKIRTTSSSTRSPNSTRMLAKQKPQPHLSRPPEKAKYCICCSMFCLLKHFQANMHHFSTSGAVAHISLEVLNQQLRPSQSVHWESSYCVHYRNVHAPYTQCTHSCVHAVHWCVHGVH
jgi:hypothetical protein